MNICLSIIGHFLKVSFLTELLHSCGRASRTYRLPTSSDLLLTSRSTMSEVRRYWCNPITSTSIIWMTVMTHRMSEWFCVRHILPHSHIPNYSIAVSHEKIQSIAVIIYPNYVNCQDSIFLLPPCHLMGLQKEVPCQDGTLNDHHLTQVIVQVNVKHVITEIIKGSFLFF